MLTNSNAPGSLSYNMVKRKVFLTVKEIAKMIGISRQAVDKRIKTRKIPTETYGRTRLIHKLDAEGLLKRVV